MQLRNKNERLIPVVAIELWGIFSSDKQLRVNVGQEIKGLPVDNNVVL